MNQETLHPKPVSFRLPLGGRRMNSGRAEWNTRSSDSGSPVYRFKATEQGRGRTVTEAPYDASTVDNKP